METFIMNILKQRISAALCSILLFTALAISAFPIVNAASSNLLPNPSVEEGTTAPTAWLSNKWGTNTSSFAYNTSGRTGGKSITVKTTAYTNGDAKWYVAPVTISPNTSHTYSDWYKSNIPTIITLAYTSTSNVVTYQYIGTMPASTEWRQASITFTTPSNAAKVSVFHLVNRVGQLTTDDHSLVNNTVNPVPTPTPAPAPTAPSVSIIAPSAGSTAQGIIDLTASASDAQSVTSVQFKIDGNNVGTPDTISPYGISWDSKTAVDGSHTVSAVATNSSGLTTTSQPVSFTVANPVAPTPAPAPSHALNNLISNYSFEEGSTTPANWTGNGWGTNTRSLTYEPTGRTGNRSAKATITNYANGDAKWMANSVPVTANTTYKYSNWYKSDVETELDVMVTMTNGTVQYYYLTSASASPNDWRQVNAQFTAPTGAASITIFHVVARVGYVQTDDHSLTVYTPAKFSRAIVSITFDDGWRNIATNGLPLLKKYNLPSTQYLNSTPVINNYPTYMTYQMIKDFKSQGSELAWHTRSHANVTTLTTNEIGVELSIPSIFLTGTGQSAAEYKNFASPYGAYNDPSINEIKKFYRSHRSTDVGYNTKDNFNIYNIKVQNILNTTTPSEVQSWINQSIATSTWLVLVYHEVTASAADPTYAVTPANLDAELNIIKQSGVTVMTVDQALNEILPQL